MMRCHPSLAALILAAPAAQAQQSRTTRPIGPIVSTSAAEFGTVQSLRHLSNGKVLINDPAKRLVVLLDDKLSSRTVVIDSVSGKDNSYGAAGGSLIPFAGDSTLFVDRTASVFLVIDPDGKVARVMPLPPGRSMIAIGASGTGYSPQLGIVFRAPPMPPMLGNAYPRPPEGSPPITYKADDTAFVVAMNPATRVIDTVASFIAGTRSVTVGATSMSMTSGGGLFPVADQMVVAADGSIAHLRAREYRVDWISADRSRFPGPRLPFDWKRNTDEDKARLVDSVNTERRRLYEERLAQRTQDSIAAANGTAPARQAATSIGMGAGMGNDISIVTGRGGAGAITGGGGLSISSIRVAAGGDVMQMAGLSATLQPPTPVDAGEIPDYMPAVATGAGTFLADADNNVWIRPRLNPAPAGGFVYDVVNRKGELIDRVQIPEGRTIVGFGAGGYVYMVARDAGVAKIEKARFR